MQYVDLPIKYDINISISTMIDILNAPNHHKLFFDEIYIIRRNKK